MFNTHDLELTRPEGTHLDGCICQNIVVGRKVGTKAFAIYFDRREACSKLPIMGVLGSLDIYNMRHIVLTIRLQAKAGGIEETTLRI